VFATAPAASRRCRERVLALLALGEAWRIDDQPRVLSRVLLQSQLTERIAHPRHRSTLAAKHPRAIVDCQFRRSGPSLHQRPLLDRLAARAHHGLGARAGLQHGRDDLLDERQRPKQGILRRPGRNASRAGAGSSGNRRSGSTPSNATWVTDERAVQRDLLTALEGTQPPLHVWLVWRHRRCSCSFERRTKWACCSGARKLRSWL
jgi:hypothetical protein